MKSEGVASEILSIWFETELVVQSTHMIVERIEIVPCLWIIFLNILHPGKEVTETSLLKDSHEIAG